jgi:hypothetical protein
MQSWFRLANGDRPLRSGDAIEFQLLSNVTDPGTFQKTILNNLKRLGLFRNEVEIDWSDRPYRNPAQKVLEHVVRRGLYRLLRKCAGSLVRTVLSCVTLAMENPRRLMMMAFI